MALPPEGTNTKGISLKDYEMKDVMLEMPTDEVSKERQMVEYSQPPSQDIEVQAIGSIETEAIEGESS